MKYTNTLNLPSTLVDAIINDPYSRGSADISVTQLIQPPKIRVLSSRHRDEMTEDVADRVWALVGNSTHEVLERAAHKDAIQEERLSITVGDWKISGQVDMYEDGIITDWKITSCWAILNGVKPEWVNQLNCYAEMWRQMGFSVKEVQIIAILRDWSKFGGQRSQNYPSKQVVKLPIPLWGHIETMNYLRDRVRVHQIAECLTDDEIPCCKPEERWSKADAWAVVKGNNKRATRVFNSLKEAEALKADLESKSKEKYRIDERPGEDTRCLHYCACAEFCNHYKTLVPF